MTSILFSLFVSQCFAGETKVKSYLLWPKVQVNVGPSTSVSQFSSSYEGRSLSTGQLHGNQGVLAHVDVGIMPALYVEASYQEASGKLRFFSNTFDEDTIYSNSDFRLTETRIFVRHRFLPLLNQRLTFFGGAGYQSSQEFRFGFRNPVSREVLTRNIDFGHGVVGIGGEYRGYSFWRARGQANYFFKTSATGDTSTFDVSDRSYFSLQGDVSHVLADKYFLSVGLLHKYHDYQISTDEHGPVGRGNVILKQWHLYVTIGAEL